MQGQRGAINSLPETLGFEHGSSSSDTGAIDQQICWNNNNTTINNNQTSSSHIFMNSSNQEGQTISMWNIGEPGSSSVTNQAGPSHIEPRPVGWPALMKSCPEPHQFEPPASMLSLGDQAGPSFLGSQPTVNPSPYHGSSSSSFSDPFGPSSDAFELDGRRLSRKRKSVELTAGQSSSGTGSSNTTSDNIIPRLGLGVGGVSNENPIVENTHWNVRLRISSSSQQDPFPANNNVTGQSNISAPYPSLRLNPVDLRALSVPATAENTATHPGQPILRIPALRRHLQSTSRWSRNSSSRPNRSSNIIVSGERNELDSRTMPTNISDHPLFIPPSEVRSPAAQTEVNWSLNGGAVAGNAGNGVAAVAASSRATPSSAAGNRGGALHYPPRRLSEFLRRSLLSAAESEASGGRNSNVFPRIPAAIGSSSSSQDVGIPAGVGIPGHHQPHSRSSILVGRHLDAAFGFPYLSRAMTAGNEGRGRLVSEIRNVLDLMRRGEPLRFEDVMILDQSVFYGVADVHDRHRDMRLDIDNMSYEELLALEERIGNVNTGLTEDTILKHLKQKQYVTMTGQPDAEPCCICQDEYKDREDLGALNCGHEFHHSCIKQWLLHKNLCPICKSTAFAAT